MTKPTRKANSPPPFFGRICAIVVQFLTPHGGTQRWTFQVSSRRGAGSDVAHTKDMSENFGQNIPRRSRGINRPHVRARIAVENAKGFGFENGQSSAHNLDDSVVRSMIFRGAPPEALSKHGGVIATQVQDERYINEGLHHARLVAVAGNAIENEPVVIRPEGGSRHMIVQTPLPEPHGQFVRHQLTARRVVHECASQRRPDVESAKNIPTSTMKKSRSGTQQPALRALAASRCTEEEDGTVFRARSSDDHCLGFRLGDGGAHWHAWSQNRKLKSRLLSRLRFSLLSRRFQPSQRHFPLGPRPASAASRPPRNHLTMR